MKYLSTVIAGLVILLNSASSLGQSDCDLTLSGKVFDIQTKEPLPFVTVQIEGTTSGTQTDLNGNFTLSNLCEEEVHLVFSHVGYKKKLHHHDTHHTAPKIFLAADDVLLESIVVEGDAVRGDLESLKSTKLDDLTYKQGNSGSFADLAGNITGVSILSTGSNVAKPIIHGLHSSRVLIINSGLRHEFQNWGADHGPEIDPSLYESLEVIKGAATVRYGPDALGGVILINPQELELDSDWNGEVSAGFQSNGRSVENKVKVQKGFHRFSFLAQGTFIKQGDLSAPNHLLSNTGKEESSYSISTRYHLPKLDLKADYIHFNQDLGILRGSITGSLLDLAAALERDEPSPTLPFTYEINNPRQTVVHDLFRLSGQVNLSGQTINLQYGYQKNERQEFDIRRGTNNQRPAINLELVTHSFDADWKKSSANGWSRIVGSQLQIQENRNIFGTNTTAFVPNYDQFRAGLFGITSYEYSGNTFELGGRLDYQFSDIQGRDRRQDLFENELTFQNFTLTAGYKRKISEELTFSTNFGTAWRPPNVLELYGFGKRRNTVIFGLLRAQIDENGDISTREVLTEEQNPIESEKGFKWVGTLSYFSDKIDGELTLYTNFIQDYINARPRGVTGTIRGSFPFFVFQQNDAVFTGADYSVKFNHTKNLSSHFTGSYIYARDVTNDSFFVGIPPANLAYQFKYEHPFFGSGKAYLTVKGTYNFRQFQAPQTVSVEDIIFERADINPATDDFDFLDPPGSFFLLDIYWLATFKKLEFSLNLTNALDQSYRLYTNTQRYFSDEVGRNLSVSISYQFN